MIATSADGSEVALMTWGRVHDSVDPRPLVAEIRRHHSRFGFDFSAAIELCYSLADVADFEYFYEALWTFAREPWGGNHRVWKREKRAALRRGEEIYKLGRRRGADPARTRREAGTIVHGFGGDWDARDVPVVGMLEPDLTALIDGPIGQTLLRLPHVLGLATDVLLDDDDRPTERHSLLIRTDATAEQSVALDDKIVEVYRRTLPKPEPDLLWSLIDEDVFRALHPET